MKMKTGVKLGRENDAEIGRESVVLHVSLCAEKSCTFHQYVIMCKYLIESDRV